MKLYCVIVEESGCVHAKGIIEAATPELVLKNLLSFLMSGEGETVQEVHDAYNEHDLEGLSVDDVMSKLVAAWDNDEDRDSDVLEALGLYTVCDDDAATFFEGLRNLFEGPVGTDFEEVSETQTTIIVKMAE